MAEVGELVRPLERALQNLVACPPSVEDLLKNNVDCASGRTAQDVLRNALRHNLDIHIKPVVRGAACGGEDDSSRQRAMTRSEMELVYTRRRNHVAGYTKVIRWALTQCRKHGWQSLGGVPPVLQTPKVAFAFWHSVDGAPHELPQAVRDGLSSCCSNSGLLVVLLTYQGSELAGGVPPGVRIEDARGVLAWPVFARLLHREKHRIQHLADYVRFLALASGVGDLAPGGWLIDGDTIWLRSVGEMSLSVACPPRVGHWFACQQAAKQAFADTIMSSVRMVPNPGAGPGQP